jgi:Ca-activated chloride channel family protein
MLTIDTLFRVSRLRLWLLFTCLLSTAQVHAAWLDWWVNADRRGIELLNNDQAGLAGETFSNPDWRGTAKFLAGNFVEAADEFSRSDGIESVYNRATALADYSIGR